METKHDHNHSHSQEGFVSLFPPLSPILPHASSPVSSPLLSFETSLGPGCPLGFSYGSLTSNNPIADYEPYYFFDFSRKENINKLNDIIQNDIIYIRYTTENQDPILQENFKVQISQHPHDWDKSILVYKIDSHHCDSVKNTSSIANILAMIITMSGRDVILNQLKYNPNRPN